MKVKVTYTYEVELSDSEFEDFVGIVREVYADENLDIEKDVEGPIDHKIADWLVLESHVGNYNKYVNVTDINYETLEV